MYVLPLSLIEKNKCFKKYLFKLTISGQSLPADIFFYLPLNDDNVILTAYLRVNQSAEVRPILYISNIT
jgi:hypothetical protein